jgi:L-rhamnose mutarotase
MSFRRAFAMRLKPGALDEYRRQHDEIWPELVEEIGRSGIATMTIFENEPLLFVFAEMEDAEALERLWETEVHRRWGDEVIGRLLDFGPDGNVDTTELREVFRLDIAEA